MRSSVLFIIFYMVFNRTLFAQVGINDDNSEPDPAAGLDVKFTNKGFLPPRLSFIEQNAIAGAPGGLMVWCTDWFLPSQDELNQMYLQRNIIGGSNVGFYWSSSEYDAYTAWGQSFTSGYPFGYDKDLQGYVRAVRAF